VCDERDAEGAKEERKFHEMMCVLSRLRDRPDVVGGDEISSILGAVRITAALKIPLSASG